MMFVGPCAEERLFIWSRAHHNSWNSWTGCAAPIWISEARAPQQLGVVGKLFAFGCPIILFGTCHRNGRVRGVWLLSLPASIKQAWPRNIGEIRILFLEFLWVYAPEPHPNRNPFTKPAPKVANRTFFMAHENPCRKPPFGRGFKKQFFLPKAAPKSFKKPKIASKSPNIDPQMAQHGPTIAPKWPMKNPRGKPPFGKGFKKPKIAPKLIRTH